MHALHVITPADEHRRHGTQRINTKKSDPAQLESCRCVTLVIAALTTVLPDYCDSFQSVSRKLTSQLTTTPDTEVLDRRILTEIRGESSDHHHHLYYHDDFSRKRPLTP